HVIGNHTYTHPNLSLQSQTQVRIQLTTCQNILSDVVGAAPKLFRPPYGGRRPSVLRIAHELGLEPVMWSITCYDWKASTPEQIEKHVKRQLRGGDVILMHDGGHVEMGIDRQHTVAATDRLISKYKAEGYEFATISEMMGHV